MIYNYLFRLTNCIWMGESPLKLEKNYEILILIRVLIFQLITDFAFGAGLDVQAKCQSKYADVYVYEWAFRSPKVERILPKWMGRWACVPQTSRIDQSPNYHNAPATNSTIHHFGTEMWAYPKNTPLWKRNVNISVPKWCIMGHATGAL